MGKIPQFPAVLFSCSCFLSLRKGKGRELGRETARSREEGGGESLQAGSGERRDELRRSARRQQLLLK